MPLQRRLPKFGFKTQISLATAEVRTSELEKLKDNEVTVEALSEAGVIGSNIRRVRIMLSGPVNRAFSVSGVHVSKGAKEAVIAAGGIVKD
jgi:large subunit ribosomal protein L15